MKTPYVSQEAAADLNEIWLYIAQDSVGAADRLVHRIHVQAWELAANPRMGRARKEFGRQMRSFPVDNYVIVYKPTETGVYVARVLHGARDVDAQF